jgi:uncharacterized protein
MNASILWTRLDVRGHESARIRRVEDEWRLDGSAVFVEGAAPVRLDYAITCDSAWNTRAASVAGWIGDDEIDLRVEVRESGQWLVNGEPKHAIEGCVDIDLNFSPSTNLLPIRRLQLAVGEEAVVRAAWLRFPSFRFEVLEQLYRRTADDAYEYESGGGSFTAQLRVNELGFPTEYAGLWRKV